jgi:hypothetical protein
MDDEERMAWGAIGFGVGWAVNQFTKKPEPFNNPLEDMWLTVIFPDYTEQVANLQALFRQQGVYFDTAFGPEGREWNLDFSLEGATTRQVLRVLNRRGLKYKISDVREQGFYSDGTPHLENKLNYSEDDEEELFINPKVRRAPIAIDMPWWELYTWQQDLEYDIYGEIKREDSERPDRWLFQRHEGDKNNSVDGTYDVSFQPAGSEIWIEGTLGKQDGYRWNQLREDTDLDGPIGSLNEPGQTMLDEMDDDAMEYIIKESYETQEYSWGNSRRNPKNEDEEEDFHYGDEQ